MKQESSALTITDVDFERLALLIQHHAGPQTDQLEEELGSAEIVPQREIPADVVTMNSRIKFVDLESGNETQVTLVYPKDADVTQSKISVLAPVGMALIGLRVGDEINWPLPQGKSRRLQVTSVLYQPEAAGDWDL